MRKGLAVIGALLATAPALAQEIESPCANLPTSGVIGTRAGPEVSVPPRLHYGQWICQPGFRLELQPPRCVGASAVPVMGNPRAACYADLPFNQRQPVVAPTWSRPVAERCPTPRQAGLILRGANIGYRDVAISVFDPVTGQAAAGMTVRARRASGPQVPTHEDPVLSQCPAYACLRLAFTLTAAAPNMAEVRLALPGGRQLVWPVNTAPRCLPPPQNQRCLPQAGPAPPRRC